MSGGGNGVCSALAISNAITNLAGVLATPFVNDITFLLLSPQPSPPSDT